MGLRYPVKYGSHLPVLVRLMEVTRGPVLELGAGMFSTPFLHWACFAKGRELLTCESDAAWYAEFAPYSSGGHTVLHTPDWDAAPIDRDWSFVFIDHAPAERRRVDLLRLADRAQFIAVHDSYWKMDRIYHLKDLWGRFKYYAEYSAVKPRTALVSNFCGVERLMG